MKDFSAQSANYDGEGDFVIWKAGWAVIFATAQETLSKQT
jgi:hypothetical protein